MSTEYGIAPPGHRLPDATRLGPVRLRVADLSRSEDFYGQVLGLERRDEGEGHRSMGADGGAEALVELVEGPEVRSPPAGRRLGLYHFALRLPERAALGRLARHLRELGVRVAMADHLVSEALYFSDPDGLGIEVYCDRPRERWRTSGRQLIMTTEPLALEALLAEAGKEGFGGVPPGTVMGHVHLHVGSLEEAARFYHEGLGFDKVVWDYPGALFLSAGGYHHHVGMNTWAAGAPPTGPEDPGLLWWTLVVPGSRDLERTVESLEAAGHRVGERDGRRVVEDPWGTAVELAADATIPSS